MTKKLLTFGILSFFLLSCVSAVAVDFFYSPNCSHCQKVKPLVEEMKQKYPDKQITFYDVTKGNYKYNKRK